MVYALDGNCLVEGAGGAARGEASGPVRKHQQGFSSRMAWAEMEVGASDRRDMEVLHSVGLTLAWP